MSLANDGDLVVTVREDGAILTFNHVCERVTGYTKAEAVGRNLLEFLVPEDWRPTVVKRFTESSMADLRAPHVNPWQTKRGERVMIEWSCGYLTDGGKGKILVGVGRPVTEMAETAAADARRRA